MDQVGDQKNPCRRNEILGEETNGFAENPGLTYVTDSQITAKFHGYHAGGFRSGRAKPRLTLKTDDFPGLTT
jgi:hypothetical protein